jgi:hypothetical protein
VAEFMQLPIEETVILDAESEEKTNSIPFNSCVFVTIDGETDP